MRSVRRSPPPPPAAAVVRQQPVGRIHLSHPAAGPSPLIVADLLFLPVLLERHEAEEHVVNGGRMRQGELFEVGASSDTNDTGERREAGAAPAGSRPFVPTRKPSLAPKARGASANTCRIAANWLMLTAGPVPASRRRYRPWVTSAAWRSSGRRGNRLRREAAAIWQTLRLSLQRAVFGLSGRLGSLNQHIRRLPSHGRSPFRSCLRLVLLLARFTFGQVLVNCVL